MKKVSPAFLLLSAVMLGAVLLVSQTVAAVPAAPDAPDGTPNWEGEISITNNTYGSRLPVITAAANSKTVIVGFLRQMSSAENDTDAYYSRSTNNGRTWSAPARIRTASSQAKGLDVTLDANSVGHAVWIEETTGPPLTLSLRYASQSSWASNQSIQLSSVTDNIILFPKIVATGNNTLTVVWAETDGANVRLFYKRSINGGSNWGAKTLVGGADVKHLDLAADSNGNLHLVWEDGVFVNPVLFPEIHYAKGTGSGSTISWTTTTTPISNKSGPLNPIEPKIAVDDALHVSFTDRVSDQQQDIHYISCQINRNCTQLGNWQNAQNGNPIMSTLGVNLNNPDFSINSTVFTTGGCAFTYFYGKRSGNINEEILGLNSCDGWRNGSLDVVTSPNTIRYISPDATDQFGWWSYITYEEIVSEGPPQIRQIRFVRNIPALYLPVVIKN